MSVKFSFIVPIFNVERYLKKCLDSLINQDYDNYEAILIDDGSTDSCGIIIDEYAKRYNDFKVIHKINEGLGEARNVGIKNACGEYIIFIDSDDWVEKNYLNDISKIIAETNADVIHCGWYEDAQNSSELKQDSQEKKWDKETFLQEILIDKIGCQVWKSVYKRSLWDEVKFPKRLYEDLYTTHCVIDKAQCIVQMEKGYYHYLIRDGNISNTFNPIKGRDIFWGFASRYEFLKNAENNIEERIYNIVFEKACKNGIQAIHGLSLIRDFEEIKKVTSYVLLKMNGKYKNLKSERIELIIANKCTRMYAYIICFFYKYIRGK